jgi:hypothetical protein
MTVAVDTYVVSVYRRGDESGKEVAGLIERIHDRQRLPFSNDQELWAFLCAKPDTAASTKAAKSSPPRGR